MVLCVLRINKDEEDKEGEAGVGKGTSNEDDRMLETSTVVRWR